MTSDGLVHPTTSKNGMQLSKHSTSMNIKSLMQLTKFVGIRIEVDEYYNYYMDQHRMIDLIIKVANITGAKDEHLPYPTDAQQPPLSKMDCPTNDVDRATCQKYPTGVSSDNSCTVWCTQWWVLCTHSTYFRDMVTILVPDTYFSSNTC